MHFWPIIIHAWAIDNNYDQIFKLSVQYTLIEHSNSLQSPLHPYALQQLEYIYSYAYS